MSAVLYAVNVVFLLAAGPLFALTTVARDGVGPLVVTDASTAGRIRELERVLQRSPGDWGSYVGLARLYDRAGAQAFSYDTLRSFESRVPELARSRVGLALAYVEIGRNQDGLRVVRRSLRDCAANRKCSVGDRARFEIVEQFVERLNQQRIDARQRPADVARVWRSVLKPVASASIRRQVREAPAR